MVGEGDMREAGFELSNAVRLSYCTTDVNRFFGAHEALLGEKAKLDCRPALTLMGATRPGWQELLVEVEASVVA